MLGVLAGGKLKLWRNVAGRLVPWLVVFGDEARLARALSAAREVDELALGLGGWAKVLRFGLDAPEPRHLVKVVPRVLPKDDLDGGLGPV